MRTYMLVPTVAISLVGCDGKLGSYYLHVQFAWLTYSVTRVGIVHDHDDIVK